MDEGTGVIVLGPWGIFVLPEDVVAGSIVDDACDVSSGVSPSRWEVPDDDCIALDGEEKPEAD